MSGRMGAGTWGMMLVHGMPKLLRCAHLINLPRAARRSSNSIVLVCTLSIVSHTCNTSVRTTEARGGTAEDE